MAFQVRIPSLGESVTEGTIVRWAKQDGDASHYLEYRLILSVLRTGAANATVQVKAIASV